jgi:hypothetical protein
VVAERSGEYSAALAFLHWNRNSFFTAIIEHSNQPQSSFYDWA